MLWRAKQASAHNAGAVAPNKETWSCTSIEQEPRYLHRLGRLSYPAPLAAPYGVEVIETMSDWELQCSEPEPCGGDYLAIRERRDKYGIRFLKDEIGDQGV
ncbi:MAG: hypothetical protein ACI8PT_001166 [Gammaproteobacteria bacterium]